MRWVALVGASLLVLASALAAEASPPHRVRARRSFHLIGALTFPGVSCIGSLAVSASGRTIAASVPCRHKGGVVYVFQEPRSGWRRGRVRPAAQLTSSAAHRSSDLGHSQELGSSPLAISANGTTIVAGDQGSVRVYQEPSGGWRSRTQSAYFAGEGGDDENSNDSILGYTVTVSGDGSTVAASDPFFMSHNDSLPFGGQHSGAVFVYQRPRRGWAAASSPMFTARLLAAPSQANDGGHMGPGALSADGSLIAAATGPDISVWRAREGGWTSQAGVIAGLQPRSGPSPDLVAFSPAGDTLVSSEEPGSGGPGVTLSVFRRAAARWSSGTSIATLRDRVDPSCCSQFRTFAFSGKAIAVIGGYTQVFTKPAGSWRNARAPSQTLRGYGLTSAMAISRSDELVSDGSYQQKIPGGFNRVRALLVFAR